MLARNLGELETERAGPTAAIASSVMELAERSWSRGVGVHEQRALFPKLDLARELIRRQGEFNGG